MAGKAKKKHRQERVVPVSELVKLAEERLRRGQPEEALGLLHRAEGEVRRGTSPGPGKHTALPPHLAAVQPLIAPLLARAFFQRALSRVDPGQKIGDLKEAVKRAPADSRYRLALGACRLAQGTPEEALPDFEEARRMTPNDPLVQQAIALVEGRSLAVHGGPLSLLTTDPPTAWVPGQLTTELEGQLIDSLTRLAAGDREGAREQLAVLSPLDHNPSRAEAAVLATQLFYSGVLQAQSGRFKQAGADLQEAQRLASGHGIRLPWYERLAPYYLQVAEGAIRENEMVLAAECWQHALELDPGNKAAAANLKTARRIRAHQAWNAGQHEQAIALWKEEYHSNPQDESLLRNLAIGCEKVGRKEEATGYWRSLAQRWRGQAKHRKSDEPFKKRLMLLEQHLIKLMMESGRPSQDIVRELESALKIDPSDDALRRQYADLLLEVGRPQQALKQLETVEQNQGESADLLVQKGFVLDQMGRRPAAQRSLQRAMELDPAHTVARRAYLLLLGAEAREAEEEDELERAVEICRTQLSVDPQYAPAAAHLASLLFSLGQEAGAKKALAAIIEADPKSAMKRVTVGTIYLYHDKKRLAAAEFKRAIEIEPSEYCFFHIGHAYLNEDDIKKALSHYDRAARIASSTTLLAIASELLDADYAREAAPFLDQAMTMEPHHPEPHLAKASMWFDLFNLDEAQREAVEAERLAAGRKEFERLLEDIQEMKQLIRQTRRMLEDETSLPPGLPPPPPEFVRMLRRYAR